MSKKWMFTSKKNEIEKDTLFTSQTENGTVPNMKKNNRVFTSQNCWIRYEKTAESNGPPCVCANIDWAVARDDSVSCGSIQPWGPWGGAFLQ